MLMGIEQKITKIGDDYFREFSTVTSVQFPSTLETIGNSAFRSCVMLTNVIIPSTVKTIESYAFF